MTLHERRLHRRKMAVIALDLMAVRWNPFVGGIKKRRGCAARAVKDINRLMRMRKYRARVGVFKGLECVKCLNYQAVVIVPASL